MERSSPTVSHRLAATPPLRASALGHERTVTLVGFQASE